MKTRALLGAVTCCLTLITGNALAGTDEEAVQNTILGLAQATTDFSKTKDRQAVLKFFAADFSAIDDGEVGSLKDVEKMLTDLEEQLKGQDRIAISDEVSHIIVQISGPLAWARYDEVLTVSGSQLVAIEPS